MFLANQHWIGFDAPVPFVTTTQRQNPLWIRISHMSLSMPLHTLQYVFSVRFPTLINSKSYHEAPQIPSIILCIKLYTSRSSLIIIKKSTTRYVFLRSCDLAKRLRLIPDMIRTGNRRVSARQTVDSGNSVQICIISIRWTRIICEY